MIDRSKLQRYPDIRGDDEEETGLLRGMAEAGRQYLTSHDWCPPIRNLYLAHGVGGVVALFLVEFGRKISGSRVAAAVPAAGDHSRRGLIRVPPGRCDAAAISGGIQDRVRVPRHAAVLRGATSAIRK